MLSLQELSDRLEIEQLIVRYSNCIDQRDWDGLDQVFTPDAYIDYRKLGGIDGRYPQIKAWLGPALVNFPHYCHLVGNIEITLAGRYRQRAHPVHQSDGYAAAGRRLPGHVSRSLVQG